MRLKRKKYPNNYIRMRTNRGSIRRRKKRIEIKNKKSRKIRRKNIKTKVKKN
jgi:hypothetical protein